MQSRKVLFSSIFVMHTLMPTSHCTHLCFLTGTLQVNNGEYVLIGHSWGQLDTYITCISACGHIFQLTFYLFHTLTFRTLTSVGQKSCYVCLRMLLLFHALVKQPFL